MNDIKPSIDEAPECDGQDINAVVAAMTPEERAEYLAWCDECREANLAYQMEHDAQTEEPASDDLAPVSSK